MLVFEWLAERKIEEAVSRGEFENLAGAGRPLELDDDGLIPEDLRAAYRILKNAGYVPPEIETLNEIAQLENLVSTADVDASIRAKAVRKLALLKTRIEARYYEKAVAKLAR